LWCACAGPHLPRVPAHSAAPPPAPAPPARRRRARGRAAVPR
jgi:hypothetical protein